MKNKVSVVIVTRNRENDLKHCLGSLACQLQSPDELVVVDNNSTDKTAQVIKNFSKNVLFKVKYVKENKVGYPYVYNRGLEAASGNWAAFIDDDCVADPNWYKNIKIYTAKFPLISVILGKSSEYFTKNVAALTRFYIDEVGKIGAIKNRLIVDHEIIDSKNVVYNRTFLRKNNIKFDVGLLRYGQGASEDCDLGMQIYSAGGVAIYNEKIKVAHKNPTDLFVFYKKLSFTLRNHLVYEKKWEKVRNGIRTRRRVVDKLKLFVDFTDKYNLDVITILLILVNIVTVYFYTKLMRLLMKSKITSKKIKQK